MPSNSDYRGGQPPAPQHNPALQHGPALQHAPAGQLEPAGQALQHEPAGRAVPPAGARPGVGGAGGARRRDAGRVLRLIALIAVAIGLAALTAAACVLSYAPVHHLAIAAGVSSRLAKLYPPIFDALLVIAGCSVLALRGAGLVSRIYAWFCLLVLLAALAGGGAVRAAAVTVPRKLAGVVAAVVPWALVLIGFGLLLALLRYARLRRVAAAAEERGGRPEPVAGPGPGAAAHADVVVVEHTADLPQRPPHPGLIPGLGAQAQGGRPGARTPQPDTTPQPVPAAAQRPPVRQVDMQLRARIPRQPAEHAAAGDAPEGPGQPGPAATAGATALPSPAGADTGSTAATAPASHAGAGSTAGTTAPASHAGAGSTAATALASQAAAGGTAAARQAPLLPPVGAAPVTEATELRERTIPRPGTGRPADGDAAAQRPGLDKPSAPAEAAQGRETGMPAGGGGQAFQRPVHGKMPATGASAAGESSAGESSAGEASESAATESGGESAAPRAAAPAPGGPPPDAGAEAAAGSMNAAPTEGTGADGQSGEPPALRRPHSSPTPPDEE